MSELYILPEGLPKPVDDGACDHLEGLTIPNVALPSTSGNAVNFAAMKGTIVCYFYPMIGNPLALPGDDWNAIPGARGCTPQSCAYRDKYTTFNEFDVQVFGVSGQSSADQKEARNRLHLPYDLVSDEAFQLCNELQLPTFIYQGKQHVKRLTTIIRDGVIQKVFYPVFPSDSDSDQVLAWLRGQASL